MKYFFILLTTLFFTACGGHQTIPVTLPDGFVIQARVADTPEKQAKGLMFITQLPENEGMLFAFPEEKDQIFWMKNTLIDLDMVFIGADKRVTWVEAEMPHSYTYTPDDQVAYAMGWGQYVLEIGSKVAAKHGVVPGAKLAFNVDTK